MKKLGIKISLVFIWVSLANQAFAQTLGLLDGANWITYAIIGLVGFIALFFVIQVADSFLAMQAKTVGVDTEAVNVSIFPKWNEIVGTSNQPSFLKGQEVKKIKKRTRYFIGGRGKRCCSEHISAFLCGATSKFYWYVAHSKTSGRDWTKSTSRRRIVF